jgi:branched-chain amino acid transport system substrate-binding protein
MPKFKHRVVVCVVATILTVFVAVIVAGCGSSTTSGPIKIGVILPYSGDGQYYSKMIENGVRAKLDEVGNKIQGRDVQLVTADSAGDPAKGAEAAKKLVEVDKVDVVLPDLFSNVSLAIQDYLATTGTPMVLTSQSLPFMKGDLAFAPYGTTVSSSTLMGPYVVDNLGYKTISEMFDDYAGAEGYMKGFTDTYTAKGGSVVQTQKPPLGTIDYAPYISKIQQADAMAIWFIPPEAPTFFKQYKDYGKTAPVLYVYIGTLVDRDVAQIGDLGGAGTTGQGYYSSAIDTPSNKTFVDMMTKKYGGPPTSYEFGGYVAASIILQAVTATKGNTEHKTLIAALKNVSIDSPTGKISFAGNGLGISNQYILKVAQVNGKYVLQPVETFEQVKNQ